VDLHTVETIRKDGPYHFYEIKLNHQSTPNTHAGTGHSLFSYFTGFEVGFHFILLILHQTASENQRGINHNATVVENILLHFFFFFKRQSPEPGI